MLKMLLFTTFIFAVRFCDRVLVCVLVCLCVCPAEVDLAVLR